MIKTTIKKTVIYNNKCNNIKSYVQSLKLQKVLFDDDTIIYCYVNDKYVYEPIKGGYNLYNYTID